MAAGASRKLSGPAWLWPVVVVVPARLRRPLRLWHRWKPKKRSLAHTGEQRGAGDVCSGDAAHFEQVAARHFGHGYSHLWRPEPALGLAGPGNVPLPCNFPVAVSSPYLHNRVDASAGFVVRGTISITLSDNPLLNWEMQLLISPADSAGEAPSYRMEGGEGLASA